ncbi:MAG: nuclear transport factor 2 family protein [Bacteroidales bacterium]|jgi:ketosteroid isomerase-like protein|nr:nuclear transport factor 2 family protein [Bacteroidales bacterium]
MNYFSFEILVVIFLASCSGNESNKLKVDGREKSSIEHVIYNNIAWAVTKDTALLKSTMAKDENLFIFNPDSIPTIGWAELEKNFNFWLDPRFRATKTEIRDLRISISQSGTVAWWSCILDDLAEWEGRPIGWKNTRWTGVLEKRDGKWLIVQMHFSFAK